MGFGPFSTESKTKVQNPTISGPVTASEGSTAFASIQGKHSVGPFSTVYNVGKGGSVTISATSGGAGSLLADAIERQAAGAVGAGPTTAAAPAPALDKKTLAVAAAVVLALFGAILLAKRK